MFVKLYKMCLCPDKVKVLVIWTFLLTAVQVHSAKMFCKNIDTKDTCEEHFPTMELSMCDLNKYPTDILVIPSSLNKNSTDNLQTFEFCERDVQTSTVTYYIKLNGTVSLYRWNKNSNFTVENNETKAVIPPSFLKLGNAYIINNYTYKAQHSQPSPVINLTMTNIKSEEMTLIWKITKQKRGVKRRFNITVNNDEIRKPYHEVVDEKYCNFNYCHYTLTNLTAFTQYFVSVSVIEDIYINGSYEANSTSSNRSCWKMTKEKSPLDLENCTVTFVWTRPSEALLHWNLPTASYNSRCVTFNVNGTGNSVSWQIHQNKSDHNNFLTNITHLIPGDSYNFVVYANNTYEGPRWNINITMPIYKPPKKFVNKRKIFTETTTTATVEIGETEYTHTNGRIKSYRIIVSKSDDGSTTDYLLAHATLPTWNEVQKKESWSLYAIKISPEIFQTRKKFNFTIGNGMCYDKTDGPCNGPLEPDTVYHISIRAYTNGTLYRDTQSFVIRTKKDNTLLLAILGIVCALAVSVWAALLWWCGAFRCLGHNKRDISHHMHSRLPLTTHPIQLTNFPKYVHTMLQDTPNMFSEEFRDLSQVGREQPCMAANLQCNRHKNRFTNILPYDHSRFKLEPVDGEDGSDYINANYVPGFHSQKDFIATQGPMKHTRDDFWRMCWESNACAIVMLTRCVEKSMEKCDHYWPYENQPTSYGDVYVATLSSNHHCNWTISELFISKGGEKRHIYHLQFIAWPDFGVPNPPSTLIQFARVFREHCHPGQRPTIVHCSAGVGRSGTFIALDRLMQQLHSRAEYLDVLGLVYSMRRARTLMVQTEQQYVCIHACIASVLEALEICRRRSTVNARHCAAAPPQTLSQQVHYNLAFEGPQAKIIHRDILLS